MATWKAVLALTLASSTCVSAARKVLKTSTKSSTTTTTTTTAAAAATCLSYGVDFQNGGSYFQNISSPDPFTFVSEFSGCNSDTAYNILVDPSGNEYNCSNTQLTPADTAMLSTCAELKDEMTSGDWSVVIISNNGDGSPIAYQRDFYLTVGVPVTITQTPTVTATVTTYPGTTTVTASSTVIKYQTTTIPSKVITSTQTITPYTTTTTTSTVTVTKSTKNKIAPIYSTTTYFPYCNIPNRQQSGDPWCQITPTIISAAALQTPESKYYDAAVLRAQRVADRAKRLAAIRGHRKRAPDSATVTAYATDSSLFPTVTDTVTSYVSSLCLSTVLTTSVTTTTEISTVLKGVSRAPVVTVTSPTKTITSTVLTKVTPTSTSTSTLSPTCTVFKKGPAPPAQTADCLHNGGTWKWQIPLFL